MIVTDRNKLIIFLGNDEKTAQLRTLYSLYIAYLALYMYTTIEFGASVDA